MSFAGFDQMLQHRTFLPPERHHNGEDALHEAAPLLALRSEARLPPNHGVSQRLLGGVVRRLDALHPDKCPERLGHQVEVTARILETAFSTKSTHEEKFFERFDHVRLHDPSKLPATHGSVAYLVPIRKHLSGEVAKSLSKFGSKSASVLPSLEFPEQVGQVVVRA